MLPDKALPVVLLAFLPTLVGCRQSPAPAAGPADAGHDAMAAAAGVTRADGGKGLLEHRIVPLKPMTGDVELLYGDPSVAGQPFVMRIRELPGAKVPPHSHPVDEHITVVQGTWYFGLGNEFKREALQELKAGSYAFAPKGSTMFGFSPDGAVVQVHGVGPFQIHWKGGLHTLDDADARTTFRFAKGTRVSSERGAARVVQGYASGEIVQYELAGADGARFMADEGALTTP